MKQEGEKNTPKACTKSHVEEMPRLTPKSTGERGYIGVILGIISGIIGIILGIIRSVLGIIGVILGIIGII